MSSNDLVYTKASLAQDAADFAANAPTFLPVPDTANTQPETVADLLSPVAWHTTKTGRVHLIRQGEQHLVEFYTLSNDELVLGCAHRRWIFNAETDTLSIKAPLVTADLQRLKSYAQILIEQATTKVAL